MGFARSTYGPGEILGASPTDADSRFDLTRPQACTDRNKARLGDRKVRCTGRDFQ